MFNNPPLPPLTGPVNGFMIGQHVAWRDANAPAPALKWRWGTVRALALSASDNGQAEYQYLVTAPDGYVYRLFDHELRRPSDGDFEGFLA